MQAAIQAKTQKMSLVKVRTSENKLAKQTYSIFKRILDIILSLTAIILLLPLFLVLAIIIKIDSKGRIIFKHKRIGQKGKIIYMYKFRTMVENAEDLIQKFTPEQKKEYEKNYKLDNDFRITRVGKILRKTSLDELPQLFNILTGDMSFVGPRPIVKKELEKYGTNQEKLLSTKPGLTGFWQAHGRSNTTYDERICMELYYVSNASLKLDIKIFFKTVISVLKREGAM